MAKSNPVLLICLFSWFLLYPNPKNEFMHLCATIPDDSVSCPKGFVHKGLLKKVLNKNLKYFNSIIWRHL